MARHDLVDPPEVVVRELDRVRDTEPNDAATQRVESPHDMRDRAVLAGRVDALQDDQHTMPMLRPQPFLKARKALEIRGDLDFGGDLHMAKCLVRIHVGEVHG